MSGVIMSGVSERLGLCRGERDAPRPPLEDAALPAGPLQDQRRHDRLPRVVRRAHHQRTQRGRESPGCRGYRVRFRDIVYAYVELNQTLI